MPRHLIEEAFAGKAELETARDSIEEAIAGLD